MSDKRIYQLKSHPRVLASPLRVELIGVLQSEGPCAIRELAAHLARPADGLYHHVRLMRAAGILVEKEIRKVGRREEVVYALSAPRISGNPATSPENKRNVIASAQAALRLTGREFAAATLAFGEAASKRGGALVFSRQRSWLTPADLRRVQRLCASLEKLLLRSNQRRQGRLHVVTTVIVPIVKRRRF